MNNKTNYEYLLSDLSSLKGVGTKTKNLLKNIIFKESCGGETGIRTQERVAPLPVFKTGAFNRSAISPIFVLYNLI